MKPRVAVVFVVATALFAAGALGAFGAFGAFARSESSAAPAVAGIAVTGDWTITVKSASGQVVSVHEFHNEFNGASTVAAILAHASSTGRYWMTLADSVGGTHPCGLPAAAAASCFVFEPDDPNAGTPGWFDNLAVSASSTGQLVITGEIAATRSGEFDHVRMLLSRCAATTAPSACTPGSYGNFSTRTLPAPITLIAGQQAIVTVTYTFSPA